MDEMLRFLIPRFQIKGEMLEAIPYGDGHINETFKVTFRQKDRFVPYLFQQVNRHVFKDPLALMENVNRVCTHLQHKYRDMYSSRCALSLIRTHDNQIYYEDRDGAVWRVYHFIENATSRHVLQNTRQAFAIAHIFGEFQRLLMDLPGDRLNETIPDFHNTPKRYKDLEIAVSTDPFNRAATAKKEIEFALEHKNITDALISAYRKESIPERIIHNDAKLNNVLLSDETQKALCIIDLDTVMPGLPLYDFGDLVRSSTSPMAEDETDPSKAIMQLPIFEALVEGYLASAGQFLAKTEKKLLPLSGKLITFEIGIRFLADFLNGDVYFKTQRKNQNLDRCRNQFRLMESIIAQEEEMNRAVEKRI